MLCSNSSLIFSWHLPQVAGTLNLETRDFGSLPLRMSCPPWQSVQTAAVSEPAPTALPCTLCWYAMKGAELRPLDSITNFWPWQVPQVCGMLLRAIFDLGSLPEI